MKLTPFCLKKFAKMGINHLAGVTITNIKKLRQTIADVEEVEIYLKLE
jgi:hypothetical protein